MKEQQVVIETIDILVIGNRSIKFVNQMQVDKTKQQLQTKVTEKPPEDSKTTQEYISSVLNNLNIHQDNLENKFNFINQQQKEQKQECINSDAQCDQDEQPQFEYVLLDNIMLCKIEIISDNIWISINIKIVDQSLLDGFLNTHLLSEPQPLVVVAHLLHNPCSLSYVKQLLHFMQPSDYTQFIKPLQLHYQPQQLADVQLLALLIQPDFQQIGPCVIAFYLNSNDNQIDNNINIINNQNDENSSQNDNINNNSNIQIDEQNVPPNYLQQLIGFFQSVEQQETPNLVLHITKQHLQHNRLQFYRWVFKLHFGTKYFTDISQQFQQQLLNHISNTPQQHSYFQSCLLF